jgi:hypothetical protein
VPGQTVGFPLSRFQYGLGWTRDFLRRQTPADVAIQQINMEIADIKRVTFELRKALFKPTNATFFDDLVDNIQLNLKALVNADGAFIPWGPNGEIFDGATHTHYDASATLTAAFLIQGIQDVVEHGHGDDVRIVIARTNEAAVKALPGFVAFADPGLILSDAATRAREDLDISRIDNRAIGRFEGATVWVKPWGVANYAFVYSAGDRRKPFVFRQRAEEDLQGLQLVGEIDAFPLRAEYSQREFGIAVWNRTNGWVGQFNNGTYSEPVITL